MTDSISMRMDGYCCDHAGCPSEIAVNSAASADWITTQRLRKALEAMGWLVFRKRDRDLRAYCPNCRKAHEDEPAMELTRLNLKRGRKKGSRVLRHV